jgi:uncharacterized membrane protein
MYRIRDVHQINGTHLYWKAEIGGKEIEWEADITEQMPDLCLAWRSRGVINNEDVVTFRPLSDMESSIQLQVAYHLESIVDIGDLSENLFWVPSKTCDALRSSSRSRVAAQTLRGARTDGTKHLDVEF